MLLGDPTFLRASILAYYDRVDRIVLSFDESSTSWTGTTLPVERCLEIVQEIDVQGKCVSLPGRHDAHRSEPMRGETEQRQAALDAASDGADWVLQLDTDEVAPTPARLFGSLDRAQSSEAQGLDYPSRWLYARVARGRYLERTNRWWQVAASYPGPIAVRSGTRLRYARQIDGPLHRVDMRARNTDPWRARSARVDEVVGVDDAILHFAWVRAADVMERKLRWSGHAKQLADPSHYRLWLRRTRHPLAAAAGTPLRRNDWYRVTRIPEPPGGDPSVER